jgi:hypothetical protein
MSNDRPAENTPTDEIRRVATTAVGARPRVAAGQAVMTVVVTHYRYKPPPKKPKKLARAVEVPTIVTARKPPEGQSQRKAPQIAVSISRKRARLLAAASEAGRFVEPGEFADDAATARAMEFIARTLKPPREQ